MATKYETLARLLRGELAGRDVGPGYRLPGEEELARRYRLSRQTVRRALRLLSEEGLIETRQGSGSYATGRSGAAKQPVAAVLPFPEEYTAPAFLHDIRSALTPQGCRLEVFPTEGRAEEERRVLTRLSEAPVRGLLFAPAKTAFPSPNGELLRSLADNGTAVLLLGAAGTGTNPLPSLRAENLRAGRLLTGRLLRRGRRAIGCLLNRDTLRGVQLYSGMLSALLEAEQPVEERRCCFYDTVELAALRQRQPPALQTPAFLERLLRERLGDADAILCDTDELAYHLIRLLQRQGRRVPEDAAVVSLDNSYFCQLGTVPLTSMSCSDDHPGRAAADALLRLMRGQRTALRELEWRLVARSSG